MQPRASRVCWRSVTNCTPPSMPGGHGPCSSPARIEPKDCAAMIGGISDGVVSSFRARSDRITFAPVSSRIRESLASRQRQRSSRSLGADDVAAQAATSGVAAFSAARCAQHASSGADSRDCISIDASFAAPHAIASTPVTRPMASFTSQQHNAGDQIARYAAMRMRSHDCDMCSDIVGTLAVAAVFHSRSG